MKMNASKMAALDALVAKASKPKAEKSDEGMGGEESPSCSKCGKPCPYCAGDDDSDESETE